MTDHRLAAAQHVAAAALHIGATDDRCSYWRLLGEVELLQGRSGEMHLQLATRYSLGLVDGQERPGQAPFGV